MQKEDILKCVDHTILSQTCTWEQVRNICEEGVRFHTASVCLPPSYVRRAADYLDGKLSVCTVIGFPNGYATSAVKAFEVKNAVANGADEVDMVINLGDVKDGNFAAVEREIRELKQAAGNKILKVIVETCFLTQQEKIEMCHVVETAGADFIKTSTGFGTQGAVIDDIKLFRETLSPRVKIKASGGIRTFAAAEEFFKAGADRLGTSSLVKLMGL